MHQSQPIQDRFRQVSPGSRNGTGGNTISFNYTSSNDQFIKDAIIAHDIEGEPVPHVPFLTYWPTYRSFTKAQFYWYAYWRTEVRQKRYPKTDLSYIFVHVYEVLSLIEMKDPIIAVDHLMMLCRAYEQNYPKLKSYVYDWAGDLIITKIGVSAGIEWWMHRLLDDHYSPPDSILNKILQDLDKEHKASELPYSFWEQLNSYRPQNKFYLEHNQDNSIDQAYLKAIQEIDTYLRSLKTPKGILDRYVSEKLYPQTKYTFSSAVVPSGWGKMINLGMAKRYKSSDRLGMFLLSITKYTENILRKHHNVTAKLSGFTLEERFQNILDKAFEITPEPVKITLDSKKIQTLQAESEQVVDLLKTEVEPKPLYSDIAQVRSMWNLLDTTSRYFLLAVFVGEITRMDNNSPGAIYPLLVKNLNEQSLQFLGDQIISIIDGDSIFIADDFTDEMELISRENSLDDLRPKVGEEYVAASTSPWNKINLALSADERALVQKFSVAGFMSESEIATFARERNQMGNLMVDSLIEKVIKYTGNNPFYQQGDRMVFDEEALEQLRASVTIEGA
ncbi:MAG: TerB N-terminal domain-containing protein [Pelolinea sp.]|nr:TerB N-terminal domain-containing protein [Pelolinea sp.]